jgi:hypothetical protein
MLNVSGWGYYDERYILSNDLLTAEVPTRPVKDCKHAGPNKICAGGLPPNFTDACAGSFGGYQKVSHQLNWIKKRFLEVPSLNFNMTLNKK